MKKLFTIIALVAFLGCTNDSHFQKGKKQLENQGYTEIKSTGYAAFCCDEKDTFSTGFKAKDKQDNEVEGCICSGVLKGVTIRFN